MVVFSYSGFTTNGFKPSTLSQWHQGGGAGARVSQVRNQTSGGVNPWHWGLRSSSGPENLGDMFKISCQGHFWKSKPTKGRNPGCGTGSTGWDVQSWGSNLEIRLVAFYTGSLFVLLGQIRLASHRPMSIDITCNAPDALLEEKWPKSVILKGLLYATSFPFWRFAP